MLWCYILEQKLIVSRDYIYSLYAMNAGKIEHYTEVGEKSILFIYYLLFI